MQQCRVLQHAEGPVRRVGNERNTGVLQHARPAVQIDIFFRWIDEPGAHHLAVTQKCLEEGLAFQTAPIVERAFAQVTENALPSVEDRAVTVTIGASLPLDALACARNLRKSTGGGGKLRRQRTRIVHLSARIPSERDFSPVSSGGGLRLTPTRVRNLCQYSFPATARPAAPPKIT